jgi:hypothetical protein
MSLAAEAAAEAAEELLLAVYAKEELAVEVAHEI